MSEKYCVMNMKKNKRADVKGLQEEANRELEEYKNEVKKELTHTNYFFVKTDDWNKKITEILEENGLDENDKSVVLITSVYSASPEWFEGKSRDEILEYFSKCLEFEQRKGEVINATVHFDETTPHMQVATVPVLDVPTVVCHPIAQKDAEGNVILDDEGNEVPERNKKGRLKYKRTTLMENGQIVTHKGLSAKTVFGNKVKMSKTQTEFYEMCGKPFGLERGEIRVEDAEATRKHLTEAQYKAEKMFSDAQAQAKSEKDKAVRLSQVNLDYITQRTLELQNEEDDLKAQRDALKAHEDDLRAKQKEVQVKEENAVKLQNRASEVKMKYDALCKEQEKEQVEFQKREDALQARENAVQVKEQNFKKSLQDEAKKEMQRYKLSLKAKFEEKHREQHETYVEEIRKVVDRANRLEPLPNHLNDMLEKAIVPLNNGKYMKFGEYRKREEDRRKQYIERALPDYPELPSYEPPETGHDWGFGE